MQPLLDVLGDDNLMEIQSLENISTTLQIGESISRHSFVEVLFSHVSVIDNADAEQRMEIARIAVNNMLMKERLPHLYSRQGLESSAFLLGAVLKKATPKAAMSPDLVRFLSGNPTRDAAIFIEELVMNYLKL